ncbi:DUF58 domain-containing protein [Pseudalkalibacillus salsuginis]|uniref:DUF58 domain-containing protein n=1 Tax=Pseudalkalibacillus salsuginis TaxID=2910972 RepID=UPI001F1FFB7F|nr:DUF58 domain-containing protein [Pseudalkalibacillus salsuginis]MCF6411543.1 DUF58 domain-containing protein [Pseudalkalibacillus salsuginis]
MIKKQLAKYRTTFGMIGLVLLLGSSFSYAMFQGGFVSWFLFYSVLPLVLYTVFILTFRLSRISVERHIESSNFISGEEMKVTITIYSRFPIPLFFLVVKDGLPRLMAPYADGQGYSYQSQAKALLFPLFKRRVSYGYLVKPIPRGIHRFKSVSLETGDLFGFISQSVQIPVQKTIQVYPKTYSLAGWNVFETHPSGMKRAGKQAHQDFTSAVSIRDYTPGDKLSWLHWKATARSNKLVTKVFETQRNDDFVIFLDGSHPSYDRNGQQSFERAVSLAASILKYSISKGTSVEFHSVSKEHTNMSFQTGQNYEAKLMYHLAQIQPDTKTPLTDVLKREVHEMSKGVTVLLISPDLSDSFIFTMERMAANKIQTIFFYIAKQKTLSDEEKNLLTRLRAREITVYPVNHDNFGEVVKAGVKNATV